MAINLGLTRKEWNRLNELLVTHHAIHVRVQLLTLEHEYIGDLSRHLLGGQVSIDAEAEVTRSLTMELLDPEHRLKLDSDSPEDGSLYYNRMARIIYTVMSPDRLDEFDIPIFCGPLSKVERSGHVISVEAQGKEKLASASMWQSKTYKKGLRKSWVIRNILINLAGEKARKVEVKKTKSRLPRNLSMNRESTPWKSARRLAHSISKQLFYDGRGVARMRHVPSKTVYVFRERGALLTLPQASFDAESVVNAVHVIGGKPKGAKKKITYRLVAPRSHPLSPWRLGRNGVPRYLPEVVSDDSIRSTSDAKEIARKRLRSALIESVDVAFDALPIPYLEEMDVCRVHSEEFSGNFRLRKMTIPLTADGVSSIGYLRRVTPNKRQLRIKGSHRKRRRRNRG